MSASEKGRVEVVKELLENGAEVNAKNNEGGTALILASRYDHVGVVKELLQNGENIDVNAKDNK